MAATLAELVAQQQQAAYTQKVPQAGGVPLPGGHVVSRDSFIGIEELNVRDDTAFLGDPTLLLENPKKDGRYVWAAKEGTQGNYTSGAVRGQRYRPVKKEEAKKDIDYDVYFATHKGTTEYIMWRDLILCWMPEPAARAQYDAPVGRYVAKLMAGQEQFKNDVVKESGGLAVGESTIKTVPG